MKAMESKRIVQGIQRLLFDDFRIFLEFVLDFFLAVFVVNENFCSCIINVKLWMRKVVYVVVMCTGVGRKMVTSHG